jgi:gamma-glutamyltranspeptidase/glutathione hydrolase
MYLRVMGFVMATALLSAAGPGGMVVSQDRLASQVGARVLAEGGNAVDAAVATAFALAVTHPAAGNLGGGGFMLVRQARGEAEFFDFREKAPKASTPGMFQEHGVYSQVLHHESHLAVGVPGTVAGLHASWRAHGSLPWKRLVAPAVALAQDGFQVSSQLASSLEEVLPLMAPHPASMAQFSHRGHPYAAGDLLRQEDLARTLERIAEEGPAGFYRGETARLIVQEMKAHGGLITRKDLAEYRCAVRRPLRGTYRGVEVLAAPPPSSGGTVLLEVLNVLEGYDLARQGAASPLTIHLAAEAMRRAYADRALYLGDPDFNPDLPLARLIAKAHGEELRGTINPGRASTSSPDTFQWPHETSETTHLSVVDRAGNAVSLTYTLEDTYGSKMVVPGAGFLLNNEMGDFNAGAGLTDTTGLVGTRPNLVQPGKRMLSSMAPTILVKNGKVFMVTGSPGGRTIPNTVLWTILGVVDFGLGAQAAVDAPRFHHQWLPDQITYERERMTPETGAALKAMGHTLKETPHQGCAQVILADPRGRLTGGADQHRWADSAAVAEPPHMPAAAQP